MNKPVDVFNGIPEGFEFVRVGWPNRGEWVVGFSGDAEQVTTVMTPCFSSRLAIIRPVKPQTKRVLVGEWDVTERGSLAESRTPQSSSVSSSYAEKLAENYPKVYRIEERPL